MKKKFKSTIRTTCHLCGVVCTVAVILQFGVLAGSAQTGQYLFTGSETTITLNPGTYDITAYGAQGGYGENYSGGLGAEMEGIFDFTTATTLTLLVGGSGRVNYGGGGGGGSFVVSGRTPLVVAGGGGGAGQDSGGGSGSTASSGGNSYDGEGGTGGNGGSGGTGGGGGGSIIDSSAIAAVAEVSGIASPDDSPNGEIIITTVPEPTSLALAGLSGLSLLLFRRQRK
jgi:hypothetical protein